MKRLRVLLTAVCCFWWVIGAYADTIRFYCGAYTRSETPSGDKADGIGIGSLQVTDGSMQITDESSSISNPSHLCVGVKGHFLYSVSEVGSHDGLGEGSVSTFRVDPTTGGLEKIDLIRSYGSGPAYVSLDGSGKYVLVANYGGGTVAVLPVQDDGTLGEASSVMQHEGKSVHPSRQKAPHPHSIVSSPENQFVFVPDLGMDRIVVYRFDPDTGNLTARPQLDVTTPPGSGPRHIVFDPQGDFAYVSLEMTSELAAYRYDKGKLVEIGRYSTLPEGFNGNNTTAEVRTAPDGKTVYISNRGDDSIAVFRVLEEGTLKRVQIMSTGGQTPRNFGVEPKGEFLIAANQNSHSLVSFRIDPETGQLQPTGNRTETPFPVLVCFPNPNR